MQRRLFGEVAHELTKPLTRLGLAVELAEGAGPTPELTGRMQRDLAALAGLRDQMLDLARLDGPRDPHDPRDRRGASLDLSAWHGSPRPRWPRSRAWSRSAPPPAPGSRRCRAP
jgi:signal transduction histidine kinase